MQFLLFLIPIFTLGAAHGLEPGHGKLLVTSYLTGSQAKMKDALLLGVLVAIFHTLSVALIGASIVFLAMTFFKDAFLNSLELISGLTILGLGLVLFWRRFIQKTPHDHQCDCHISHSTIVEEEVKPMERASLKEVILLALASGMTPCPMALTALIAAFGMGKAIAALGALAVFSLGIGSVLIILGILIIKGSHQLQERWQKYRETPVLIAKLSTVFVLILGVYLVTKPFVFPESAHAHLESFNFLMSTHR